MAPPSAPASPAQPPPAPPPTHGAAPRPADGRPLVISLPSATGDAPARIAQAMAALRPALVLVFASDGSQLGPVASALRRRLGPQCHVVGCSSAGEFAFAAYGRGAVVAVAFPESHFRAETVWLQGLRDNGVLDWMAALRQGAAALPEVPGRARFGILLIDGLSGREELVTATVEAALPGLLVVGGSAADGLRFGRTHLLADGHEAGEGAVLCLMSTDLGIEEVVFDHFTPREPPIVVTAAAPDDRLVIELNAEPAAEEYARLVGLAPGDLCPQVFAENPLLVQAGGRHFVRAIREVGEGGSLLMMSAVEEGLVLTLGQAENPAEGLNDRLSRLGGRASLVLGFDCILRRVALEEAGLEQRMGQIFRAHRVAGFNTYGEQHSGIHVNQTFVGLAFLEGPPMAPGQARAEGG